ncbi:MAG: ribonuclease HI family protein [Synergistaceae bacterium]|nr:ribonuclease HI family protein [Synergistaceae bacterium]
MEGHFDGASRGNPGNAGAGAYLIDDSGSVIWETARFLGTKTNNEAEYGALILLLTAAREKGAKQLKIYGDSKLVVSQVSKQWKIKLPHLRKLAEEAWRLMEGMDVTLEWVPREQNARADELSNEALDSIGK